MNKECPLIGLSCEHFAESNNEFLCCFCYKFIEALKICPLVEN